MWILVLGSSYNLKSLSIEKYMISAFYNSNYDPAISYDCEDNGLMKAPMYWSFFLYENTV